MSSKERSKREKRVNKQRTDKRVQDTQGMSKNNRADAQDFNREDDYRSTDLRNSAMMAHLLDALEEGVDIGHYGRLTFVMVARHFLSEGEMVKMLAGQPDFEEKEARAMVLQVKERDYNPPKRERILQWMEHQGFPICPNPEDPNGCNVYRELQFPEGIYDQIDNFWEEKVEK